MVSYVAKLASESLSQGLKMKNTQINPQPALVRHADLSRLS